jgi:hypothetical protein
MERTTLLNSRGLFGTCFHFSVFKSGLFQLFKLEFETCLNLIFEKIYVWHHYFSHVFSPIFILFFLLLSEFNQFNTTRAISNNNNQQSTP